MESIRQTIDRNPDDQEKHFIALRSILAIGSIYHDLRGQEFMNILERHLHGEIGQNINVKI